MSSLPVVGGGAALGLAMGGGGGGRGGAGGRGVLVGSVGDGAGSYPCQGQTAGRTGLACPVLLPGATDREGVTVSTADLSESGLLSVAVLSNRFSIHLAFFCLNNRYEIK